MRELRPTHMKNLIKCLSGTELMLFEDRARLIDYICAQLPDALSPGELSRDMELWLKRLRSDCVYEVQGILRLHFIIVHDGETGCYLALGPCMLEKINEAELRWQLKEYNANPRYYDEILSYCGSVPQLSYAVFHQLGTLLAQWLLGTDGDLPYRKLDYKWNADSRQNFFITDQYEELARMRVVEQRYENASALTEAVKCGNLSLAYHFLSRMSREGDSLVRHPDPLRNRKNLCIILNTQLRHALEGVGIHPYVLDRASGEIALHIESLGSLEESERYVMQIIQRYCELPREHVWSGLRPFTHQAVIYIKNHLNETLTVKDTARALLVNPDYLSSCFHKELGVTFIDFVNAQRAAQAAALLNNTTLQIQQIATLVGYNNTSYFARQFARHYNMTPRDYRRRGMEAPNAD